MEETEKAKKDSKNRLKGLANVQMMGGSIKLILPRDVQNANSLIFSQINLNKYSWDIDGEKVNII